MAQPLKILERADFSKGEKWVFWPQMMSFVVLSDLTFFCNHGGPVATLLGRVVVRAGIEVV